MIHLERYDRIDPARVLWSILHFPELYEEWGAIYEMYRAPVGTFEDYMANGLDVLRAGGGGTNDLFETHGYASTATARAADGKPGSARTIHSPHTH